jgi:hypothetical protein
MLSQVEQPAVESARTQTAQNLDRDVIFMIPFLQDIESTWRRRHARAGAFSDAVVDDTISIANAGPKGCEYCPAVVSRRSAMKDSSGRCCRASDLLDQT